MKMTPNDDTRFIAVDMMSYFTMPNGCVVDGISIYGLADDEHDDVNDVAKSFPATKKAEALAWAKKKAAEFGCSWGTNE